MAKIKNIILTGAVLVGGMLGTSCNDWLELGPIDYYGSENYWETEENVIAYVDGLHKALRDVTFNHTIVFGELRGGHYIGDATCDGSSVYNPQIINQMFDLNRTGVSNFGDIYGRITNCNLLLARIDNVSMNEARKEYYKGIAYGLRAFYYFELHRLYGGVPLRLDVAVIDGELDPVKLYMGRHKPSEVLAQIKADIKSSLDAFGNQTGWNPYGHGAKSYWNKAATECLAADVYLWSGKVSVGDHKANSADLDVAKSHLNNVINNYGLALLGDFAKVFDARNKANDEIVFAVRYAEGEATNNNINWCYSTTTGQTWQQSKREDGSDWGDPFGISSGGGYNYMGYEYKKPVFESFDREDSRRDATFIGSYRDTDGDGVLELYGTHVLKNIGYINSSNQRIFCGDYIFYRLAWAYLALAEIANYQDNKADVEKYMNLIRERAYGENWDKDTYGYVAGDFTQNELAILQEKTKEFIQEGQRWWDLLRMTYTKGGDALVFHKEASIDGEKPILDKATEAHKVLWPINKGVMDNDSTIFQTPGYGAGSQKECQW